MPVVVLAVAVGGGGGVHVGVGGREEEGIFYHMFGGVFEQHYLKSFL